MANRFPLVVNPISKRIEEITQDDNLNLTGNGLVANGSLGISGQYLKSDGSEVIWERVEELYFNDIKIAETTASKLRVSGLSIPVSNAPTSRSAPGEPGDIKWDSDYVYVCVATDTWKRAELLTW